MTWQVPWYIDGGAVHPGEVQRTLGFAALSGAEGVIGPGDCQVLAMPQPGGQIRVMPGAVGVRSRGPGAASQSYIDRNDAEITKPITATGSAGGRSDLVVARVLDPELPGSPAPASVPDGPYMDTEIIEGVPSTTEHVDELGLGYTALTLARIDLPANTAAVDQSMIVDLRQVALPRRDSIQRVLNLPNQANQSLARDDAWHNFPAEASWQVGIPDWAVRAQITGWVEGVQARGTDGQNAVGQFRGQLGTLYTASTQYNHMVSGTVDTMGTLVADDLYVPADHRGTVRTLVLEALGNSANPAHLEAGWGTVVVIKVEFYESADDQAWV